MVTLLPKKNEKASVFSAGMIYGNAYSFGALLVLAAVVSAYFAFLWYGNRMSDSIEEVQAHITAIEEQRDTDLEQEVTRFASKLEGIDALLDSHIYSSRLFPFIESITHPKVQFTNFNFTTESGMVTLKAVTQGYTTLGEQIIALKQNKDIHNLTVSGISLKKTGEITFTVSFEAEESLYR